MNSEISLNTFWFRTQKNKQHISPKRRNKDTQESSVDRGWEKTKLGFT